ncbi:MAG: hypothetical protein NVS4B6_02970 [Mycobacterium sp.]
MVGGAMNVANKEMDTGSHWWRKLRTVPVLVGTTVLTALVGAGVTWMIDYWQNIHFDPSDAVTLSVETDPAKMSRVSSSGSAVIPSNVKTRGTPGGGGGCDDFHSWVAANSGRDAGTTVLQIAAQSTTDKPVLLQNMRVSVIDTSLPLTGIAVECSEPGAALQPRYFEVNLDAGQPRAVYKSDTDAPFPFTLAKGETESFIVTATAAKATYRWKVLFDVVVNGKKGTLQVGDTDGYTTTVHPNRVWRWGDGWNLYDQAAAATVANLPGSEPLPPTN